MSISVSGWTSLSFIIGMRLCPPARIRDSGPNLASNVSACSMLLARSYSTYAGTCTRASPLASRVTGHACAVYEALSWPHVAACAA